MRKTSACYAKRKSTKYFLSVLGFWLFCFGFDNIRVIFVGKSLFLVFSVELVQAYTCLAYVCECQRSSRKSEPALEFERSQLSLC